MPDPRRCVRHELLGEIVVQEAAVVADGVDAQVEGEGDPLACLVGHDD
jgi:hypothetical protein